MPTYTLRPVSYTGGGASTAWAGVTSNTQMASFFGDNSDATFATRGPSDVGTTKPLFALGAPTVGAGEFVVRIGSNLRWRGGGSGNTLGTLVYRLTDAVPSNLPAVFTDGRTIITTTEVGLTSVNWSIASLSTLRTAVEDTRSTGGIPTTTLYDVWAVVYTLSIPSVSVSNQTVTTTPRPNIAVSLTPNIGAWEALQPDVSNSKRVVTEVRIESGGTGVGTGTLVSYNWVDQYNAQIGTVNVPTPYALSNGTYNIYARATRFRDNQTVDQATELTDQSSAWTSAATLTMNNPVPTAPTVNTILETTNKRVAIGVTPIATNAVYAPATIEVERSINGGTTWSTVRTSPVTPSRQNLINNSSFETNTTGWTAGSNTTLARSTAVTAQAGSAIGALTAIAAGNVVISSTSGTLGSIVSPNLVYTVSAWGRITLTASRTFTVEITWFTSAGASISTNIGTGVSLSPSVWTQGRVTATAPSNAAFAQVRLTITGLASAGEVAYVDAILLEQASTVGAFVDFVSAVTVYDFEMPRGVALQYRARINAYSIGLPTISAYTTNNTGTLALTSDWSIKSLTNPSLNLIDVQVVDKPTEELTEDLGVFRPLDRRYPVVVAGQLGGYDGELSLVTSTAGQWTALKAILESQQVLYLESPYGWSKYIRIISGAKAEILGTNTAPRRRISVSYVEVSAP